MVKNKIESFDFIKREALDKIENWTELKIGQSWKLYRIEHLTELKIGQNWKLDKIDNWTELKIGQNWKLDKIENWTNLKIKNWTKLLIEKLDKTENWQCRADQRRFSSRFYDFELKNKFYSMKQFDFISYFGKLNLWWAFAETFLTFVEPLTNFWWTFFEPLVNLWTFCEFLKLW